MWCIQIHIRGCLPGLCYYTGQYPYRYCTVKGWHGAICCRVGWPCQDIPEAITRGVSDLFSKKRKNMYKKRGKSLKSAKNGLKMKEKAKFCLFKFFKKEEISLKEEISHSCITSHNYSSHLTWAVLLHRLVSLQVLHCQGMAWSCLLQTGVAMSRYSRGHNIMYTGLADINLNQMIILITDLRRGIPVMDYKILV